MDQQVAPRPAPETTLERASAALAAGGAASGVICALLAARGGASLAAMIATLLLGSVLAMAAITALGAPVWLVLHLAGRRGARTAALTGAALGFILFLFAQTYGFGLAEAPPADTATWAMRWLSGAATSLGVAVIAGGVALLMWRVAYR